MKNEEPTFYSPYENPELDFFYNLLFCDDLELFRKQNPGDVEPWKSLMAAVPDIAALETIAQDRANEGRVRTLAFNILRKAGQPVPKKVVLGVIVEVPLDQGLDVLAAFSEGGVRYINQSGKLAVFESAPPEVEHEAKHLVEVSQPLVNQIGPWEKSRLPPPRGDVVRLSFLVSDGLYFGQGPYSALRGDPLGGVVLEAAERLLQIATSVTLNSQ